METLAASLVRKEPNIAVETLAEFAAGAHFVENHSASAPLPITLLGETFLKCFVPVVEGRIPAMELVRFSVVSRNTDRALFQELSHVAPATLSQIFWLMKKQAHGTPGPLCVNYSQNIFPVRCIHGDVLNVCVSYHANESGWHLFAIRKDHEEICFPGAQLIIPAA